MALLVIFLIIIIVLVLLSVNYENNKNAKELEKQKEKYLNQDVNVFGVKHKMKDFVRSDSSNIQQKLEKLRIENQNIKESQDFYFEIVRNAEKLEKNKEYEKAIIDYEKALEYAYSEPILKIHNYAFSIHRLIILYGRTKQKNKLKLHLENSIEKNPNYNDAKDWKQRLEKLKKMT
jgi:hypothetical protein